MYYRVPPLSIKPKRAILPSLHSGIFLENFQRKKKKKKESRVTLIVFGYFFRKRNEKEKEKFFGKFFGEFFWVNFVEIFWWGYELLNLSSSKLWKYGK